jgi:hypothetical protein
VRGVLIALVVLAVCAAAWLIIDSPFAEDHPGDPGALENKLLDQLRQEGQEEADQADCKPRPGTAGGYLCSVVYGLQGNYAHDMRTFLVTVDGDGIHARARTP